MTTSTEQIAALIASNTALKEFFEGERTALELARNNLPSLIYGHVYVDTVNGLPGNDGTFEEPFNTLDAALSAFKPGQLALISLLSDVVWDTRKYGRRVSYQIRGRSADNSAPQHRAVTFSDNVGGNAAIVPGIGFVNGGMLFSDVDIVMGASTADGAFFVMNGFGWVSFESCTVDGAGGTSPLIDRYGGSAALGLGGTVFSNMGGRWVRGFAAGVSIAPADTGILTNPDIDNT